MNQKPIQQSDTTESDATMLQVVVLKNTKIDNFCYHFC